VQPCGLGAGQLGLVKCRSRQEIEEVVAAVAATLREKLMTPMKNRDREEITAHIHSIFQAYVDRDLKRIRDTHTADWTGFQGPSTKIERGIDDYMKNAESSLAAFEGTGFELLDTEVQLYGDVAVVYYVARYDYCDAHGADHSLPLRSVDIYRREQGHWIQAGSHITPIPQGAWGEGSVGEDLQ
jgi:ketosteroid isomerase-like protein